MLHLKLRGRAAGLFGACIIASFSSMNDARADEGGVSFWLPGFFGSLAAAPQQPGWSLTSIYYHTSVSAGVDVVRARELETGRIPLNLTANVSASLQARADLGLLMPTYTFATPVFGGVHNYMIYITGDVPVGAYDSTRLSNIGIGHGAIDAGGGYTYLNPQTGHEFSGVLGFTYNFENRSTQYQNGVDMHLDWGASQFLTKQFQIGAVGYVYREIGCDSGSGDRVGCFQSRVVGVGPQLGFIFPVGDLQGYLNLKYYSEFPAE